MRTVGVADYFFFDGLIGADSNEFTEDIILRRVPLSILEESLTDDFEIDNGQVSARYSFQDIKPEDLKDYPIVHYLEGGNNVHPRFFSARECLLECDELFVLRKVGDKLQAYEVFVTDAGDL